MYPGAASTRSGRHLRAVSDRLEILQTLSGHGYGTGVRLPEREPPPKAADFADLVNSITNDTSL
jgi:hypothetical protein